MINLALAKRTILLVSGSLALTSCLTVGYEFNTDVTWITLNKTSRKEIDQKFGEPFRRGWDSGYYTYTYVFYRYSVFRPTRTRDLTVRFSKDDTVFNYSFSSSFPEDKERMPK